MANYCMNDIVFYSINREQIVNLFEQVKSTLNSFKCDTTLFKLLQCLENQSSLEIIKDKRNFIIDCSELQQAGDEYFFHMYTEAAWVPHIEDIDLLLSADAFSEIQYVYTAEEPGMEIYVNSDVEHKFLDNKYLFYYWCGNEEEDQYFSNEDNLKEYLITKFSKAGINREDKHKTMLTKLENWLETRNDNFGCYIHEFELPEECLYA